MKIFLGVALLFISSFVYLSITIIDKSYFCRNCGAFIKKWEIAAFDILDTPVSLYTSTDVNDTGLSLFLGKCNSKCNPCLLRGVGKGILGENRMFICGDAGFVPITDNNPVLLYEFLTYYERDKDPELKDKLRMFMNSGIDAPEMLQLRNNLYSEWEKFRIRKNGSRINEKSSILPLIPECAQKITKIAGCSDGERSR